MAGRLFPNFRDGLIATTTRKPVAELDEPVQLASTSLRELKADFDFRVQHRVKLGEIVRAVAYVKNTSSTTWLPETSLNGGVGAVRIGGRVIDANGNHVRDVYRRPVATTEPIAPGQAVEVPVEFRVSEKGVFQIEFDLVAERVGWFGRQGGITSRHTFEVV
jgi:hypothetical protein